MSVTVEKDSAMPQGQTLRATNGAAIAVDARKEDLFLETHRVHHQHGTGNEPQREHGVTKRVMTKDLVDVAEEEATPEQATPPLSGERRNARGIQEIPVRCNGHERVLPEHRGSWRE